MPPLTVLDRYVLVIDVPDTLRSDFDHSAAIEFRLPVTAGTGLQTEDKANTLVPDDPVIIVIMAHDNCLDTGFQTGVKSAFFQRIAANPLVLYAYGILIIGIPAAVTQAFFQSQSFEIQTGAIGNFGGFFIAENGNVLDQRGIGIYFPALCLDPVQLIGI